MTLDDMNVKSFIYLFIFLKSLKSLRLCSFFFQPILPLLLDWVIYIVTSAVENSTELFLFLFF